MLDKDLRDPDSNPHSVAEVFFVTLSQGTGDLQESSACEVYQGYAGARWTPLLEIQFLDATHTS